MTDSSFNSADVTIIGFVIASALWAFARGFVREILGAAGWVGAGAATIYGVPYLNHYTKGFITIEPISITVSGIVIFLVCLTVLSMISGTIANHVRTSSLSALDRMLGFMFGIARGIFIICLGYIVLVFWMPEPLWLVSARSLPLIKRGSELLTSLAPGFIKEKDNYITSDVRGRLEQGITVGLSISPSIEQLLKREDTISTVDTPTNDQPKIKATSAPATDSPLIKPYSSPITNTPHLTEKDQEELDAIIQRTQ